jgi:hypothetical protein
MFCAIGVQVLKVLMFHYDTLFPFNEQYLLHCIKIKLMGRTGTLYMGMYL